MSSYRYLGYGITNENGVAQLKYDENGDELEHSYTGVGAGEVDVIASTDNPITSSSIVSGTYSIYDTLWYDDGITNPKTAVWNKSEALTVDVQSDGTLLTNTITSNTYYASNNGSTAWTTWVVEFTCISVTGYTSLQFGSGTSMVLYNKMSSGDKVKIVNDGSKLALYLNGVHTGDDTSHSVTNAYIRLLIGNSATLKFKDFMIYSI